MRLTSLYLWGIPVPLWVVVFLCFGLAISLVLFAFFYYALQMSRDQECFAKYPPRLPNLLSILTGEEKAPGGFRNRINFWGDIVGFGWGLFFTQAMLISRYILNNDVFCMLLVLFAYFLFALFFAGIPRRRYWGMIFLCGSLFVINSIYFMIFEELLPMQRRAVLWGAHVLPAWYMLCFTLLGVAGLWVFRKK